MADKSQDSLRKANQTEEGYLGPLREILRQLDDGELTLKQLQLMTEHLNPFDPVLLGEQAAAWVKSNVQLDSNFFRVDSFYWPTVTGKDGTVYKVNPKKDIREIVSLPVNRMRQLGHGEIPTPDQVNSFCGIQLFTRDAILRETRKANKHLPSVIEWKKVLSDHFSRKLRIPRSVMKRLVLNSAEYYWELFDGLNPNDYKALLEKLNIKLVNYYYEPIGSMTVGVWGNYHCQNGVSISFDYYGGRCCISVDPVDRMKAARCLKS